MVAPLSTSTSPSSSTSAGTRVIGFRSRMLARSSPASNRQATGVHRLVPPGDVAALAEELGSALAMPPALLRTRARAMIPALTERFSLAQMQNRTLDVYDERLGTRMSAQWLLGAVADRDADSR